MQMFDTPRLRLRPVREDDLEFIFELHQHPLITRFLTQAITPDLATAAKHIERFSSWVDHEWYGYPIVELRTGEQAGTPVGLLMIQPIPPSGGQEPTEVEIGWRQHPEHCGQGYMTEAASAMLDALGQAGLSDIVVITHPENTASQNLARRIGMTYHGLTEDYYDARTALFRKSLT